MMQAQKVETASCRRSIFKAGSQRRKPKAKNSNGLTKARSSEYVHRNVEMVFHPGFLFNTRPYPTLSKIQVLKPVEKICIWSQKTKQHTWRVEKNKSESLSQLRRKNTFSVTVPLTISVLSMREKLSCRVLMTHRPNLFQVIQPK